VNIFIETAKEVAKCVGCKPLVRVLSEVQFFSAAPFFNSFSALNSLKKSICAKMSNKFFPMGLNEDIIE